MEGTRARVERIRARLDHPIIDSDGHDIAYLPLVREELRALAEEDFRRFAFASPVAFWTAGNPRFFEGGALAEAARKECRS